VPALRERREDIPLLAEHFIGEFSRQYGQPRRLSPAAMPVLKSYSWPGNVRELKNMVERLVILAPGEEIGPDDLPPVLRGGAEVAPATTSRDFPSLKAGREEFEREFILRKLQEAGGNVVRAAELLGLERSNLYRKMRAYGIRGG